MISFNETPSIDFMVYEYNERDKINYKCYERLAIEYDSNEHATCRDFDKANQIFLDIVIANFTKNKATIEYLDIGVGTGKSIEALISIFESEKKLKEVFHVFDVLDLSKNMLFQVKEKFGALITNFFNTSIFNFKPKEKYDLIIATLCDPYLSEDLLLLGKNLLKDDNRSRLVLTFPSNKWANEVRDVEKNLAIFRDRFNNSIPSWSECWSEIKIISKMEEVGLRIEFLYNIPLDQINNKSVINRNINKNIPLLTGVVCTKL